MIACVEKGDVLGWTKSITTMLWPYELKDYVEQLNVLKLDYDGITPMENSTGTTTDITLKNNHTCGCPVYVLDAGLQGNISGLPKWEPSSRVGIYLGHSPFHEVSVPLVLNPATVQVSPQFHVVFDDEISTVPLMREGKIPPNWIDLVHHSSQSGAQENIDLMDTWFTPDLEEYPSKNPTHELIVALENFTLLQSTSHAQ